MPLLHKDLDFVKFITFSEGGLVVGVAFEVNAITGEKVALVKWFSAASHKKKVSLGTVTSGAKAENFLRFLIKKVASMTVTYGAEAENFLLTSHQKK